MNHSGIYLIVLLTALCGISSFQVLALDAGEIQALTDMNTTWGAAVGWTGPVNCSWAGITCVSGHVTQMYVFLSIILFFSLSSKYTELTSTFQLSSIIV